MIKTERLKSKKWKANRQKKEPGYSEFRRTSQLIMTVLAIVSFNSIYAQIPSIASLSPGSGAAGSTVTILGSNFDAVAANNVVYFGAAQATVNSASASELIVTVPFGATYAPVTVLVNNLIAESKAPFVVTFDGNDAIDANTFLGVQTEAALSSATFSVLGDMDGDGLLDVVTTHGTSTQITVYPNTSSGAGSISLGTGSPFTVHELMQEIILSDFDGDGLLDIATCNVGATNRQAKVSILRNTSSGVGNISFASPIDYDLGNSSQLQGLASGDLDGDGQLDIVVAYSSMDRVRVYQNQSSGPGVIDFLPLMDIATGTGPRSVKIADLDGDDAPDIVVVDETPNVAILRNTSTVGAFSFESKVDFTLAATADHVTTGDIDGDGLADIVASYTFSSELSVFRNTSSVASLSMATRLDYSTLSNQTALADLNGDGIIEMVSFSNAQVNVYKNTSSVGAISHAASQAYNTGGLGVASIALGDMDNDGEPDLVAPYSDFIGGGIGIFKNARSENDLLSFSFAEQTGGATIDAVNHTIDIEVANGTDVTNLVATFTSSATASDVEIGATSQSSGVTSNDFTNPVVYTVAAEDALTQDWTVTVSVFGTCSPDNVVANESACDSFDFDGATLTASGAYNATLVNQAGCDSLVTLNLTIHPSYNEVVDIESCDNYVFDGATLTASGTYNGGFTSAAGCDSLVTLNLTILESTSSIENVEECESYTWNGTVYTASGTYQEMFTNALGCDSTATLNLTILEFHDVNETLDHCGDYQFGSQLLTESGTYMETFQSQAGCDSTVTLTFGYIPLPTAEIELNGVILFAEEVAGATYQWYDCDTDQAIPGEDKRQLTPPRTGEYYVQVSNGVCSQQSDCILYDWILATSQELRREARVYPTNVAESFTLDLSRELKEVSVRILSMNGNEVFAHKYESFVKSELPLRVEGGMYIVQVEAAGETLYTQRIFKK